jgi:hypothetical protein
MCLLQLGLQSKFEIFPKSGQWRPDGLIGHQINVAVTAARDLELRSGQRGVPPLSAHRIGEIDVQARRQD